MTVSAALLEHYAGAVTTLARLWRLTRRDGEIFGFTDHDEPIVYDGIAYEPSSVFDASAVQTRSEFNVDNLSAAGLIDSAGITAQSLDDGDWDGAAVWIAEVNFADLSMGHRVLRYGTLGQIERAGGAYTAELRGLMYALGHQVVRVVTPACSAVLGDERCGVDLEALRVSGTVVAAASSVSFTTDLPGEDVYTYGVLTWTGGANAGRSMEIKRHAAAGAIDLQMAMPGAIVAGDAFTVTPGCDKRKATCADVFDNVCNFRGFSYVPGQDKVLLVGGQQ